MTDTLYYIGIACGLLGCIINMITIYFLHKDIAQQKKEMSEDQN